MADIRSIIEDTIYSEFSWISGDDKEECNLYVTGKRLYFSKGKKMAVFKCSNVERIAYSQNSGGNLLLQIYMTGNSYQVFNFPDTDEGRAMADEVFKDIIERIR